MAWLESAERQDLELEGKRLVAWSWGEGPTVLLVHGWEGRGSQMAAFAAPLAEAGFRAVAFDAPGAASSGVSAASTRSNSGRNSSGTMNPPLPPTPMLCSPRISMG